MISLKHVVVLATCLASCSVALADLAKSNLTDLLAASELIIRGRVVQAQEVPTSIAGSALIRVLETYKGTSDPRIRITWTSECDDQPLEHLGAHVVFFLSRRPSGTYVGAEYGVSFWPVTWATDKRLFMLRQSPVQVNIPGLLTTATIEDPALCIPMPSVWLGSCQAEGVYVDELVKVLHKPRATGLPNNRLKPAAGGGLAAD